MADARPVLVGVPVFPGAPRPLRVLIVQNAESDPESLLLQLNSGGFDPSWKCVGTGEELAAALASERWDVILSALTARELGAASALDVLKRTGLDIPFVVVSDAAGEDLAVDMMRGGASDYILKHNLARLAPAVERELRDADNRRECRLAELAAAQLAAIVESSNDPIISCGLDDVVTSWNTAAERLYGWTAAESVGRHISFIVPPDRGEELAAIMARVWRGERVDPFETVRLHKSGSRIDVAMTVSPVLDRAGHMVGSSKSARDIGPRKEAEAARDLSEERFRALVEHNSDAIVVTDEAAVVTYASESIARVTGHPPGEWVGRPLFERVDPAHCRMLEASFRRAIERPGDSVLVEYRSRHADGSWRDREASFVNRLDDPAVLGVIANFRDTTARRRATDGLQRVTEQLSAVVSSLPIALWAIDRDGRITLSEGKLLERLGFGPGELVGQSVFDVYKDVPQVLDTIHRVLAGEVAIALSTEAHGVTFDSHYEVMRNEDGLITGAISIGVDVSDRVRLEARLRQALKLEAVGGLAAGIAHDFNNLLTAILGFSDLVLARTDIAPAARLDLDQIRGAGASAAALTSQLLAFSRKQILQPQILDLNQLVKRIEKLLRRTIGEDIQLMTLLTSPLGRVCADPGQIDQVILNLAVNARDAMPAGGTLTIETGNVELDRTYCAGHPDAAPGPNVMVAVSDTGVGMDDATRARLFEPFFTTKELGKGTGLGLATVDGIVKQSGGSISVDSELGSGTTFKVYLPRTAPATIEAGSRPLEALRRGTETVLLVDDQVEVRAVACACLARHGYTVLEAAGGDEALRLAKEHEGPIHLLLTDVVMPAMSGAELASALSRSRPDVRVLYASGYTSRVILDHGIVDPDVDLIQKPFTVERLLQKVRDVLDREST